jgi:hypothetical protein
MAGFLIDYELNVFRNKRMYVEELRTTRECVTCNAVQGVLFCYTVYLECLLSSGYPYTIASFVLLNSVG